MMKKRLLCALLLLALALSLLPTVALADDTNTADTAEELQNLLNDKTVNHIKLIGNINLNGKPLTIPFRSPIEIDMAGYTISGGTLVVHNRTETNLTGGGTINCLAELNGSISGNAKFLQKVTLVPDDDCKIYGGSFYGDVTTDALFSSGTIEIRGGTFYGAVTASAYTTGVYGGVFHEDVTVVLRGGAGYVVGGVFYKAVTVSGGNSGVFAGIFFDEKMTATPSEGTVSMEVIFDANGGTPETVTAKAVAGTDGYNAEYAAPIAPPEKSPTREGYIFTDWFTAPEGGEQFIFENKWSMNEVERQKKLTLYAHWEEAPEEPEETDTFPALAAGALLLAGDDNPFRDVRAIDWFYNDVMYAYDRGLIIGTAYDKFSPKDSFTRGMLLTILARHDGVNTKGTPWYQAGCDWAAKNGISDGENPEEAISREEFALILYRYAQYLGKQAIERADLSRYTDAGAVSETALPAVQWAAAEAILRGDNFRLNPQDGTTRAEAAAMLHRFFTR